MAVDDEEIDAYVVGEPEPLEEFKGKVKAIVYRANDNDDKLVVAIEGKTMLMNK